MTSWMLDSGPGGSWRDNKVKIFASFSALIGERDANVFPYQLSHDAGFFPLLCLESILRRSIDPGSKDQDPLIK